MKRDLRLRIELDDTLDWGCDHTDADICAYEDAVTNAIQAAYPDAAVTVECANRHTPPAYVSGRDKAGRYLSSKNAATIERHVLDVARDVWDAGDFWPREGEQR